ncbi:MAG TPA: VIT1/CCC1 transporter family protein [Candidatus Paceibacterota bacterium]|nr:VIT1/CCC1 transporter family protein [Candidatus Paceibacterota bacterium]
MKFSLYLRTIIFGITDSLVSTVGLLAGIDLSGTTRETIILTGLVYAFVEAFSMAVGNFLSEESAEEYETRGAVGAKRAVAAGVVMFIAFVLAAFIPLAPYFFLRGYEALAVSVGVSIFALFLGGVASGAAARLPLLSRGLRMALLGGAAILIGAAIGLVFKAPS